MSKLGANLPQARGEKKGGAAHARRMGVHNCGVTMHKLLHVFVRIFNT